MNEPACGEGEVCLVNSKGLSSMGKSGVIGGFFLGIGCSFPDDCVGWDGICSKPDADLNWFINLYLFGDRWFLFHFCLLSSSFSLHILLLREAAVRCDINNSSAFFLGFLFSFSCINLFGPFGKRSSSSEIIVAVGVKSFN